MTNPTYATLSVFSVLSERPGEPGWTVDGATIDGAVCAPFTMDDAIAKAVERLFDTQTTVPVLLSLDQSKAEFVALDSLSATGDFILTDGEGRFFDAESRRPVDRTGNRISLAHAEHNARNFDRARRARAA